MLKFNDTHRPSSEKDVHKTRWQKFKEFVRPRNRIEQIIFGVGGFTFICCVLLGSLSYMNKREEQKIISSILDRSPEVIQRLSKSDRLSSSSYVRTDVSKSLMESTILFDIRVTAAISFLESIPCSIPGFRNWREYIVASADLVTLSECNDKEIVAFANDDHPSSFFICQGKTHDVFELAIVMVHEATHLFGFKQNQFFGPEFNVNQTLEFAAFTTERTFLDDVLAFSKTEIGEKFLKAFSNIDTHLDETPDNIKRNILQVFNKTYPGTER